MWLTPRERTALAILGLAALVGFGVLAWFQRRPAIHAEMADPVPYAQWDAQLQAVKQVDVNRATASDLERLPEIGPSTAQRIIEYRNTHGPFRTTEELLRVQGIGPKTLDIIQEYVTVN